MATIISASAILIARSIAGRIAIRPNSAQASHSR
jgi:hypothetical protein